MPIDGDYAQIADVFTGNDSARRLVILGAPGAGKSMLALRLTIDLLHRRTAADPVPVLLPLSAWDPEQPLADWIAGRLAVDHPALRRRIRGPRGRLTLAGHLVAERRILPILDGLDEIAEERRPDALAGIDELCGADRHLVLTCRTVEYEQAAAAGVLTATPVVEIQPLSSVDVIGYLTDGTREPDRWRTVFRQLEAGRAAPLTEVLDTPLMVWLARVVYESPSTDPNVLLTADWAGDARGIARHLLGGLVPAVYRSTPAAVGRVQQWLANLARYAAEKPHELAWWRLRDHSRLSSRGGCLLVALGLCALWSVPRAMLADGAPVSVVAATIFGPVTGITGAVGASMLNLSQSEPKRISLRLRRAQVARGLVVAVFLAGSLVIVSVGIGLFRHGWTGLAHDLLDGLRYGGAVGLAVGVAMSLFDSDSDRSISPRQAVREDRTATLVIGLAFAVITGGTLAYGFGPAGASVYGLTAGLVFGFAVNRWPWFCLARITLAIRGQTPWRLLAFLDGAHRQGILRQDGGVYQFRHARLQEHLAARPADSENSENSARR